MKLLQVWEGVRRSFIGQWSLWTRGDYCTLSWSGISVLDCCDLKARIFFTKEKYDLWKLLWPKGTSGKGKACRWRLRPGQNLYGESDNYQGLSFTTRSLPSTSTRVWHCFLVFTFLRATGTTKLLRQTKKKKKDRDERHFLSDYLQSFYCTKNGSCGLEGQYKRRASKFDKGSLLRSFFYCMLRAVVIIGNNCNKKKQSIVLCSQVV